MQALITWFNDPLVQSVVISPFVGAVLGILFAGLNNVPPSNAPVTVQQTIIVFKQTIVVHQNGQSSSSSNDVWAYFFGFALIVVGVTWGYSRYFDEILGYWLSGLFSCTTFILSAGIASAIRHQYSNPEWVWYIFVPVIAVGFGFYLLHLAQLGIIPNAREVAQKHSFLDFYLNALKNEHRMWLLFQIIGVFLGIVAGMAATLRSVYYLALMNQRANGALHAIWHFLARITYFSSRKEGIFLILLASGISYILLSGVAYKFWERGG
ncbi:hypothetical protein [Undibacterium sp. Ji49W]|uniref:hypothetical protein n=1 Tax=Undibacterium sp. Ji49W TaxID=3413040 RepID=UPI003BF08BFE